MADTLSAVLRAFDEYHTLGASTAERWGALFVRNPEAPTIDDANHVRRIRTRAVEADALFAEANRWFADLPYRSFRTDPLTTPVVEARLALEEYEPQEELILVLEGEVRGARATPDMREVASEDDWRAWWELKELSVREGGVWDAAGPSWMAYTRSKCPPVRYVLARDDERPTGFFSVFVCGGVGYLEDLYVRPEYRLRGIATALVARCHEEGLARGAALTFLPTLVRDTPKRMYVRMGFRPLAVVRSYRKRVQEPPKLA